MVHKATALIFWKVVQKNLQLTAAVNADDDMPAMESKQSCFSSAIAVRDKAR